MRPKHLPWIPALIVAGSLLVGSEPAAAGGTAVVAPEELSPEACEQGVHPRILGFRQEVAPKVIGCARLSDGDEVLVAADSGGRYACFYAALTGDSDDGVCSRVGPGAPAGAPLIGGSALNGLSVRAPDGGSGAYVTGLASREVAHVFVRYRIDDRGTREWPATVIRVRDRLARQLGVERPFAYFVGEIPKDADTCSRLIVEGRDGEAELIAGDQFRSSSVFGGEVPLPGSKDCKARRAKTRGVADTLDGVGTGLGADVVS